MIMRFLFKLIWRLLPFALLILLSAPQWPLDQNEDYLVRRAVGSRYFDFLVWELEALGFKARSTLAHGEAYLSADNRKQIVLDYLALLSDTRKLEAEIDSIFADPAVEDAETESADLRTQRDSNRKLLTEQQPIAESILQEQVAVILNEEGFGIFNNVWPPVSMHMTPLPSILITSPRDRIEQIHNEPLVHGLTAQEQEEIEAEVLNALDQSAYITPIGGLGIFPSMIIETSNINFLADVIAHEWAHHWLTFHPLGFNYAASPTMRTINETVASIVGTEIGALVIERYYPEHVPETVDNSPSVQPEAEPQRFDFRIEMRVTRLMVDEFLEAGKIEEAEVYMEERRQHFWDNGYRIRKLNQAYFAFHGAYADTAGATGSNPIGPLVNEVRADSESLEQFLDRVAPILSFEDLVVVAK